MKSFQGGKSKLLIEWTFLIFSLAQNSWTHVGGGRRNVKELFPKVEPGLKCKNVFSTKLFFRFPLKKLGLHLVESALALCLNRFSSVRALHSK